MMKRAVLLSLILLTVCSSACGTRPTPTEQTRVVPSVDAVAETSPPETTEPPTTEPPTTELPPDIPELGITAAGTYPEIHDPQNVHIDLALDAEPENDRWLEVRDAPWAQAYAALAREGMEEGDLHGVWGDSVLLHDFDADGIPELLIADGMTYEVYTYDADADVAVTRGAIYKYDTLPAIRDDGLVLFSSCNMMGHGDTASVCIVARGKDGLMEFCEVLELDMTSHPENAAYLKSLDISGMACGFYLGSRWTRLHAEKMSFETLYERLTASAGA